MKALALLTLLQLTNLSAQDSCQTATPFDYECVDWPPVYPQSVTVCRTFQTGGAEVYFNYFYSANCSDLSVTYQLLSNECDTLATNSTGSFNVIPNFQYVICVTVECLSAGGVREVCPFEMMTLPVELAEFTVRVIPIGVLLEWWTLSETGTDRFIVWRSFDGETWNEVASVPAQGPAVYRWTDLSPQDGWNYYRLTSVDIDGYVDTLETRAAKFHRSEVVGPFDPFDAAGRRVKP